MTSAKFAQKFMTFVYILALKQYSKKIKNQRSYLIATNTWTNVIFILSMAFGTCKNATRLFILQICFANANNT